MEFRFDPNERRLHIRTLVPPGEQARVFASDDQFPVRHRGRILSCPTAESSRGSGGNAGCAVPGRRLWRAGQYRPGVSAGADRGCDRAPSQRRRRADRTAPVAAERGRSRRRARSCDPGLRHPSAGVLARVGAKSPKDRYDKVMDDLQMIGQRNMLCGMHVHVEFPDPARRIDVMTRMLPYLPLFIALSTSSPFWQRRATGLKGYRLAAYDELPRTGLPELFRTTAEYDAYVDAMVRSGRCRTPAICGGRSVPRSNIRPWNCGRRIAAPVSTTRRDRGALSVLGPLSCTAILSTMPGSTSSTAR